MTTASEPPDPSQNIDEFLKIHWLQLEIDALKLAKVYSLDLNELLSRTQVTMIAVGTALAGGPPRRSQCALLTQVEHAHPRTPFVTRQFMLTPDVFGASGVGSRAPG